MISGEWSRAGDLVRLPVLNQGRIGISGAFTNPTRFDVPPSIVDWPAESRAVVSGTTAAFAVTVSGTDPFTFEWRRFGAGEVIKLFSSSQFSDSLAFNPVRAADAGIYQFTASNPFGSASRSVQLTVLPASQTIDVVVPGQARYLDPPFTLIASASSQLPVTIGLEGPVAWTGTPGSSPIRYTGAGWVTVRVTQAGNGDFASLMAVRTFEVARAPQSLQFGELPDVLQASAPLTVEAKATSGLPVVIEVIEGPARLTGAMTFVLTGSGVVGLRASAPGGDNYFAAAPVERRFRVLENRPLRLGIASSQVPGLAIAIVRGPPWATVVVERTSDLRSWEPVSTNLLDEASGQARIDLVRMGRNRIFRGRLVLE